VRGDAVRLAQRERGVAVGEGDRLAHHLVGRAAVELEVARQRQRVGAPLLERLADVQRLEPRQLVGFFEHERAHLGEQAAALGRAERTPGAVERRARRTHRVVDVGRLAACDRAQQRALGRVEQRQRPAARRRAPAAADEDERGIECGSGGTHAGLRRQGGRLRAS